MNLNMQSVSRTAAVIEWPSAPPKKQQKRRFGRHDLACVLLISSGWFSSRQPMPLGRRQRTSRRPSA